MCDSRMEGKAGLVYPSLCRMKASTLKHLEKASNQDWELTTQLQCQNVELWYVPWFFVFFTVSGTFSIRFLNVPQACTELMPPTQVKDTVVGFEKQLDKRIGEIDSDRVRAATLVHPRNFLKMREETDKSGPMHKLMNSCKQGFYKVVRQHNKAEWANVQNVVVEYLGQKGVWLDGVLLRKAKDLSLEAFCEKMQ